MPGTGLTETIRQIAQFPTKTAVAGGDLLLLQSGGLGGPYQTVAAANLVATALAGSTDEMLIGGSLGVEGDLGVSGALSVTGNSYMAGQLNIAGALSTDGPLISNGDADVAGNLDIAGNINVVGGIVAEGAMLVSGGIGVGNNSEIRGALTVTGPTVLSGGMSMCGPLYVSGGGSYTGDLMTGGGIATGGGAKFGGDAYVAGSGTFEGGVGMIDCLSVGKDATIGGAATIVGNLTAPGCVALGPTGITGDLGIFGNLCLAGNFTAEGITTLRAGELCVTGDAAICGNLKVAGLLDAGSGYFKDGLATDGNMKVQQGLYVGGPSSFGGPVFIHNDLTVNGRVGICGTLHLNGSALATEWWVAGALCHVGAELLDAVTDATHELRDEIRDELNDKDSDLTRWIRETFAPIHSPHFTGVPQTPTPSPFSRDNTIPNTEWIKNLMVEGIAGVASFNGRGGHVELQADDIEHADGVLQPPHHPTDWYAWRDGDWHTFDPMLEPVSDGIFGRRKNGGLSWEPIAPRPPTSALDGNFYAWRHGAWSVITPGIDDPANAGLFGRQRNGGVSWQPVAPAAPSTADTYFAWRNNAWAAFEPGGGGGGGGIPEPSSAGLFGRSSNGTQSWQAVPPLPPSTADTYYAWRNGAWTSFSPGGGGTGGGITQQDLDNALANYLPLAGGILSGALTLPADGSGSQAVRYSQLSGFATTAALTGAIAAATADMATQTWVTNTATADMATRNWVGNELYTATAGMATQSWASAQFLALSGGTLSGAITLPADGSGNQAVRYSQMSGAISTATSGMATQTWVSGQIAALPAAPNTLQFSFVIPGKPAAGQVYNVPVSVPMNLAANYPGSVGVVGANPAAAQSFAVRRNGSAVGTVSFATNGTVAFSGSPLNLAVGDILGLVAPTPQDASLADIGISLLTTRAESPVAFQGLPGRDGAQIIVVANEATALNASAVDPANFYVWA